MVARPARVNGQRLRVCSPWWAVRLLETSRSLDAQVALLKKKLAERQTPTPMSDILSAASGPIAAAHWSPSQVLCFAKMRRSSLGTPFCGGIARVLGCRSPAFAAVKSARLHPGLSSLRGRLRADVCAVRAAQRHETSPQCAIHRAQSLEERLGLFWDLRIASSTVALERSLGHRPARRSSVSQSLSPPRNSVLAAALAGSAAGCSPRPRGFAAHVAQACLGAQWVAVSSCTSFVAQMRRWCGSLRLLARWRSRAWNGWCSR